MKFSIKVRNNKILQSPQELRRLISRLFALIRLKDGDYVIEAKKDIKAKSNPQLAYLHGVVIKMITQAFNDSGDIHTPEYMKKRIKATYGLTEEVVKFDGEVVEEIRSFASYNKEEMSNLIETLIHWAYHSLGIEIPSPELAKSKSLY